MKRFLCAGIILLCCCAGAMAVQLSQTDGYGITFTILEADLVAPPGGTAAWNYTVENSSFTWWVSVAGFGVSPEPSSVGSFFFDGPGASFPLGPGSTAAGAWGTYYVDPAAVVGASALLSLQITYDLFPDNGLGGFDPDNPTPGTVTFADPGGSVTVSDVPEPATGVLLGAGVALLWLGRRRS